MKNYFFRYTKDHFTKSDFLLRSLIGLLLLLLANCKKFIQIDPPNTQIGSVTVFTDNATANSAISGIYSQMMQSDGFASGYQTSIALLAGLSADEFQSFTPNNVSFYTNSIAATNPDLLASLWQQPYAAIYASNSVIEGLAKSSGVDAATKKQLLGEAYFIRAFCHFYLANLFGDIPLILTTDYRVNSIVSRTAVTIVNQQIIADLFIAQANLSPDYSFSMNERVRPNQAAATALLARVYLYNGDWADAETQASKIIGDGTNYHLVNDLNNVFLANSPEAIWQLMPVAPGQNTWEGIVFRIENFVALSDHFINSFEPGDLRKTAWVNSYTDANGPHNFPYKYKISEADQPVTEYSMVLRLAELYLVRAEARAQQNDISGSQADLNTIRNRAGLSNTTTGDVSSLLQAIAHERQIELFSEWGHRWFDLKRTNTADNVLGVLKSPDWQSTDVLYPIPRSEIINDPNLTQNPGY